MKHRFVRDDGQVFFKNRFLGQKKRKTWNKWILDITVFFLTRWILILDFFNRFLELPTWALGGSLISTQSPSLPAFCSIHSICSFLAFPKKKRCTETKQTVFAWKLGTCKIHWCHIKMKHSTVLVWGKPHHSCVTCQLRPPHMAWAYKDLPHRRANDTKETWSRLPRESSTCFCLCVLMFYPKNLPRISIFTSPSRISNLTGSIQRVQLSQTRISF